MHPWGRGSGEQTEEIDLEREDVFSITFRTDSNASPPVLYTQYFALANCSVSCYGSALAACALGFATGPCTLVAVYADPAASAPRAYGVTINQHPNMTAPATAAAKVGCAEEVEDGIVQIAQTQAIRENSAASESAIFDKRTLREIGRVWQEPQGDLLFKANAIALGIFFFRSP